MEIALGWIAVAVGGAGVATGVAFGRGATLSDLEKRGVLVVAMATLQIVVVLFLLTRLTEPPFSFGQRLGYGILAGGLLGIAAGVWSVWQKGTGPWNSSIAAAGIPSLSLLGVGLVLLVFGGYPQPVLGGFLIGAMVAAIIFRFSISASEGMTLSALR